MPFTIEDDVLVAYRGSDEVVTVPTGVQAIGEGAFKVKRGSASDVFTSVEPGLPNAL